MAPPSTVSIGFNTPVTAGNIFFLNSKLKFKAYHYSVVGNNINPLLFPLFKSPLNRHPYRPNSSSSVGPDSILSSSSSPSALSSAAEAEAGAGEDEDEEVVMDPTEEVRFLDPDVLAGGEDGSMVVLSDWELDFCSRPILDERGKKVWELVVCDSTLSLQYTKFFRNNVINSVTLRDAIASIAQTFGLPLPEKIRFFRSQMQTIITKACNELGIKPVPSKRLIARASWIECTKFRANCC